MGGPHSSRHHGGDDHHSHHFAGSLIIECLRNASQRHAEVEMKGLCSMGMLRTRVWDVTGSRSQSVEAPDNVEIGRIIVILVERMGLPLNSPDGQIMSYKLHHKRTGQQL